MAEFVIPAVTLALKIFDEVLALSQRYNDSSANLQINVNQAKVWLLEMQASLRDSENQIDGGSHLLRQCVKHVENTAYDIEDALSEYVLDIRSKSRLSQKMHGIIPFLPGNDVKKASSKLSSNIRRIMSQKESFDRLEALLRQSSSSTRKEAWPDPVLPKGDEIVGFKTRNEELLRQLIEGDKSRLTILIAGPGGSGKSTMVNNAYGSQRIRGNFGYHAWVHVPSMELEKLLLKILKQFEAQRQEGKHKNTLTVLDEENDTKEKLRLLLQRKRFLVVLDNVWNNNDLDIIVNSLPKGFPGSKIIITTRHSNVMSLSADYIHDLSSGLSSKNAKDLFCKKAFQNSPRNWPSIVEVWAQRILDMCEGMPLAISAIGTFLANKPVSPVEWKTVHDNLGYQICKDRSDLSVISRNLEPSYRDLPSNLKSCFLYFSMFPKNESISRERLIRLWVAEGFVMSEGGQPEEKAADLLDELVKRNLVVPSAREVDGRRVRRCRVLHLVREINISRRKSFLTVLEQNYNISADSSIRRLSVNNGPIKSIEGMTTHIRTLLVFGLASSHSDLEMILKTSKFLRILDLQGVALEKFPNHVVDLTLLKYLSLKKTQIKTVPKSIKKLVDLETLDLRHTSVSCLPNQICKLEKLRHLLVFCKDVGSGGVELFAGNLEVLSSMQKLSCIKVENNRGIIVALSKLTGLRKLGLADLKREDGEELCSSIQNMKDLSRLDVRATSEDMHLDLDHMRSPLEAPLCLQRLYMEGRLQSVPKWIPELSSLTKIGLKWSKLESTPANPLEPLQGLPNLMELDLFDYYTGEQLVFRGDTFKKLLILCMEQFDQLKSMTIEEKAMPQLKKLSMCTFQNLKALPAGIGGLKSLDEFSWKDMPDEFITDLQNHGKTYPRIQIIHLDHS